MRGDQRDHCIRRDRDEDGFTMMEVLVAMAVFSIVVVISLGLLLRITQGSRQNELRVAAASLANRQIEAIRGTNLVDIPDGLKTSTAVVGATTFTVSQNAALVASGASSSLCASTSSELAYKLVTITVTWPGMGTVAPVRADTLKAVGTNVLDGTKGTLAVQVSKADGQPASGVAVTLSPSGASVTTGGDGCAVFSQVAVGTYTVNLNTTGYVGARDSQAESVGSVGVTSGSVIHADVLYDVATAVNLTTPTVTGATVPAGVAIMMSSSYTGDQVLPTCGADVACADSFPGQVKRLFPTQRTFWTGTCHDARTTTGSTVLVAPPDMGATSPAVEVPMALVTVDVLVGGTPAAGRPLYAVHAADAGGTPYPACPAGETFTLPNSQIGGVKVLLPYGEWTFATNTAGTGGTTVTLGASPSTATVSE